MSSVLLIGVLTWAGQTPDDFTAPPLPLEPDDTAPYEAPPSPAPPPDAAAVPLPDEPTATATSDEVDEDLGLRVVGALCGGILGAYLGQWVTPLIVLPVIAVGFVALVFFGPTLVTSSPQLALGLPVVAYFAIPILGLIGPLVGAAVVGTLGYQHTPSLLDNVGRRFQDDPPASKNQAMAY